MAKLNARQDHAVCKWRGVNGRQLVLTREGRLLLRPTRGSRYRIVRMHADHDQAASLASLYLCYEELILE